MAVPEMTPIYGSQGPYDTLNTVLGAARTIQGLQTGQLQQQQLQLQNQQLQQQQQAVMNLGSLVVSAPHMDELKDKDGNLDIDKFRQKAWEAAGPYAAPYIGNAIEQAKGAIGVRDALMDLQSKDRAQIVHGLLGAAQDAMTQRNPDGSYNDDAATLGKLNNAISSVRDYNKDPEYQRQMDNVMRGVNDNPTGTTQQAIDGKINHIKSAARMVFALDSKVIQGADGRSYLYNQDTDSMMPVDGEARIYKGAPPGAAQAGQAAGQTGPAPGAGTAPQGAAPQQTSLPQPGGAQPQAAPQQYVRAASRPSFNQQDVAVAQAQTTGLGDRIKSYQDNDTKFQESMDALSRIRGALDNPDSVRIGGANAEQYRMIRNTISRWTGIPSDNTTELNELAKNMARYQASKWSTGRMTDSHAELLAKGTSDLRLDNQSAKDITTQSMANEMANHVYAAATRGGSAQQAAANEQALNSIPLTKGYELQLMRTPDEVKAFLKRTGLSRQAAGNILDQMDKLNLPSVKDMGVQ